MDRSRGFGRKLRAERKRANLTQSELADAMGWHHTTVSRHESGSRDIPSRDTVVDLEAAIGIDDGRLLTAAGYATASARRSLSYNGEDLTPEQEQEVLDYIDWLRDRGTT